MIYLSAVWAAESGGPREPRIRWGSKSPNGKGQLWEQHAQMTLFDVSCAKTAEPMEM